MSLSSLWPWSSTSSGPSGAAATGASTVGATAAPAGETAAPAALTAAPAPPPAAAPAAPAAPSPSSFFGVKLPFWGSPAATNSSMSPSSSSSSPSASSLAGESAVTRAHWVPDTQATFCSMRGCSQQFGWLERRHHCRRCGEAVCQTHFGSIVKLNEHAIPDPNGWPCPVCDNCFLQYQRRELIKSETVSVQTDGTRVFYIMPDPGPVILPDMIFPSPSSTVYLGSILQHLTDTVYYMNEVRNAIVRARDSVLKREYMQTEKQRFNESVKSLDEHYGTLNGVVAYSSSISESLRNYLILVLRLIESIKTWALSADVFLLLSGMASLNGQAGELPEEDFAKIEARTKKHEAMAEGFLATLFEIDQAAQQAVLQKLSFLRARMQHDFYEYKYIGGPEMESFMQRLTKSMEYIDMHMEMCTGDTKLVDMQSTQASYENAFYELLSEAERLSPDDTKAVNSLKQRFVDVIRDVAVFKNLLQKSDQTLDSEAATPSVNAISSLVVRMEELENDMRQLETLLEQRFQVQPENLHQDAEERFKSLQVHRNAHHREEIEEDLFSL